MRKGKTKRILLGIMLCGAVSSSAYADAPPAEITVDQDWVIGTGEGQYQFHSGEYTLAPGVTVTMTEAEYHATGNGGDALCDTDGTGLTITGSAGSSGSLSRFIINGYGTASEAAINGRGTGSDITLNGVDLEIHNYKYALYADSGSSISITNDRITVAGSDTFYQGTGNLTINTGVLDVTIADITENVPYGIYLSGTGEVHITADTISFRSSLQTDNSGAGIAAANEGSYDSDNPPITLTGRNITIDGFRNGMYLQQSGRVYIQHTGTGEDESLDILNSRYYNANSGIGILAKTKSTVMIESDGVINISGNAYTGLLSDTAAHAEDERAITVTGKGNTVINLDGNGSITSPNGAAVRADAAYGILFRDIDAVNISNTLGGPGIWVVYSSASHGVDIENANKVALDTNDIGIYSVASYGVNITNVNDVTVKNCLIGLDDTGISSTAANGINLTVRDGGSVTVNGNGTGIETNKADGVTIKGVDGDYFPKLEVSGNTVYGLSVMSGGTLNFSVNELLAEDNAVLAYAAAGRSAITLTADKATITGRTENASDDYTLYAENGGVIILNAGDITASRDSGYFAYADTNEESKIDIKAETGTIKGAFWTGDTGNTAADSSGTINLDLGESAEWTVTDNSKVTNLALGDASGLVFSYAGGNDDAGKFLNLYAAGMNSGNGSSITMNINGAALDQSDRIYINGTHSGSSIINLIGNGTDLTDDVIGTRLVSVVTEEGSFTAGAKYEGALKWYEYTLNSVDKDTDGGTKDLGNGSTVTNTDGYNTDWYIDSYTEINDSEPEPEPDPDPEPTPDPDPDPDPDPEPTPDPDPDPDPEPAPDPDPDPESGPYIGDLEPGPAEQDPANTTTVNTVIASNAVNYYAFRETDKLLRRMGELRNNGEDEQGVWIRVKGAKTGRDNSFENKYTHYELGYDHLVKNDHREKRYEGVSLSYMDGSLKYSGVTGSGKAHDEEIAFYRVDQYKHGHYLDLVTRIGMYSNRFGVYDTNMNRIRGKNDTYGISTSAEYGRKKDYAHGWYVEPQGQATIGYLSGSDYTTSNEVDVSNGSISSAVGRIGVNIGKGFTDKNGRRGKFYAKANWLKEFLGSYGIDMVSNAGNRVHAHGNYRDTWFEWGFGVTYQYTKNNFFYADVEKSEGSSYYKNWAWNVGLRWTFN